MRKLAVSFSLILSINYPAYCVGVISVCAVMTGVLILAYKLEKWKVEYKLYAAQEFLQFGLLVGFAVFIMLGEGYLTGFKVYFAWGMIFLAVIILLIYLIFSIFLVVLWII
jgi:hypothetical protein